MVYFEILMLNLQYNKYLRGREISVSEWDTLQAIFLFFTLLQNFDFILASIDRWTFKTKAIGLQGSFLTQGNFILNLIVQNNKASWLTNITLFYILIYTKPVSIKLHQRDEESYLLTHRSVLILWIPQCRTYQGIIECRYMNINL